MNVTLCNWCESKYASDDSDIRYVNYYYYFRCINHQWIYMRFSVFIAFIVYAKFTFFIENLNFSLYKI